MMEIPIPFVTLFYIIIVALRVADFNLWILIFAIIMDILDLMF